MLTDALLAVAVIVILLGAAVLVLARRKPDDSAADSDQGVERRPEQPGYLMHSETLRLAGKPDALINQDDMIIPVVLKTGRTPDRPHDNHLMQLAAYCHLVEQTNGTRPPHGVIRYSGKDITIPYTLQLEQRLIDVLADMHRQRHAEDVHRNHHTPNKCVPCRFYDICSERLGSANEGPSRG